LIRYILIVFHSAIEMMLFTSLYYCYRCSPENGSNVVLIFRHSMDRENFWRYLRYILHSIRLDFHLIRLYIYYAAYYRFVYDGTIRWL